MVEKGCDTKARFPNWYWTACETFSESTSVGREYTLKDAKKAALKELKVLKLKHIKLDVSQMRNMPRWTFEPV